MAVAAFQGQRRLQTPKIRKVCLKQTLVIMEKVDSVGHKLNMLKFKVNGGLHCFIE